MVRRFFSRRVCLSVGRWSRRASRVGVSGTRGDRFPKSRDVFLPNSRDVFGIFSRIRGLKNHPRVARSRMLVLRHPRSGRRIEVARGRASRCRDRGARLVPSFRRGGRADRRTRGRDIRVCPGARADAVRSRGGHYLERTSLATSTGGIAPSRRERRRRAGRRRRRWRVRRPCFTDGRVRTRLGFYARAVMIAVSRYRVLLDPDIELLTDIESCEIETECAQTQGLVPTRPSAFASKQQPSGARRLHQIGVWHGAARRASSPRGGRGRSR